MPTTTPKPTELDKPQEYDPYVIHIPVCEGHDPLPYDQWPPCFECNVALCGRDLTTAEWGEGEGAIPCPICHALENEEW